MNNRRKKANLCDEWNEAVYENVRDKVVRAVDSERGDGIIRRKKDQYDNYIRTANEKRLMF